MKTLRGLAIGQTVLVGLFLVFRRRRASPPQWQEMTEKPREYPTRWESGEGDLHLPAGKVRATMVLVPGTDARPRR